MNHVAVDSRNPEPPKGRKIPAAGTLALVCAATGAIGLTAWNATRSGALEQAGLEYARRDFPKSLQHALDHLDRRPWSEDAALLAARSLGRLDYPDAGEAYYRRAGRLSLDDLQFRASGLMRVGRYQAAVLIYREILSRSPDDLTTLRRLAAAQFALGEHDEVLKIADRMLAIRGGEVIGFTFRGLAYHDNKQKAEAVAAFERVLQLDPALREMPLPPRLFWANLADDLVTIGRSVDAKQYLARAVALTPEAQILSLMGRSCQFDGELDDAERWFRQSTERDPSYDLPWLHLGQIALLRGRVAEARDLLQHARALMPRRYETLYNLAITYRRLDRPADAERWAKQAEELRKAAEVPGPKRPESPGDTRSN